MATVRYLKSNPADEQLLLIIAHLLVSAEDRQFEAYVPGE
jgi:hypothetical protein